jgi:hypothetical protein
MDVVAFALSLLVAASGWVRWALERRGRRAAQDALQQARQRSLELPFLRLSSARFNHALFPTDQPGRKSWIPAGTGNLLCFMRYEVDRERPGVDPVRLLVENRGGDGRAVTIEMDGGAVFEEFETECGQPLYAIAYPYRPECHGRPEALRVRFLAVDGFYYTHLFETRHGLRHLVWIDPGGA